MCYVKISKIAIFQGEFQKSGLGKILFSLLKVAGVREVLGENRGF